MNIKKNTISPSILGWVGAVGVAFTLALAAPNDSSVMGRLPLLLSTAPEQAHAPKAVPRGADRTLALITFRRDQGAQADSWIQGLDLNNDTSISWMRMPVLNDPGNPGDRTATEKRLRQRYAVDAEQARLRLVFTDRESFVRSAGLGGIEQSYAVVINRHGDVLARVGGQYDPDKAQTLKETLKARSF